MTTISISSMLDRELLERIMSVAGDERKLTADLLALIGECETRRLYLGEGCSSLFTYCTRVLHFSEHAAYHRIEAVRATFPQPSVVRSGRGTKGDARSLAHAADAPRPAAWNSRPSMPGPQRLRERAGIGKADAGRTAGRQWRRRFRRVKKIEVLWRRLGRQ